MVRLFRRQMSRAEAIAKAIDTSDPGDSITIHAAACTDTSICTCTPKTVYVGSDATKHPVGFRMNR